MPDREPNDHFDHAARPTADEPLNAPAKRSTLKPLLVTLVVFAVLAVLYFLGAEYLVNAD